jgi:4-hydroxy-tetrahydrodipicolinate synthase
MTQKNDLKGVFCAAATPFKDSKPDLDNLQRHIRQLIDDGCDGVLLLGTTGEGPSLGVEERTAIIETAMAFSDETMILAGTGSSSLDDTIVNTRRAFDLGVDAVVVIPPYYFKGVNEDGLFAFYQQLFDTAVPDDGLLMAYHIPQVTQVPITAGLLQRLIDYAGDRMAAIKDSSGDLDHSRTIIDRFPHLRVFVGNDKVLLGGLQANAAGCITAGANVLGTLAVNVYRAFRNNDDAETPQTLLTHARSVLDQFTPASSTIKHLLSVRYQTVGWDVRPPLTPLPPQKAQELVAALQQLDLPPEYEWLHRVIQSA